MRPALASLVATASLAVACSGPDTRTANPPPTDTTTVPFTTGATDPGWPAASASASGTASVGAPEQAPATRMTGVARGDGSATDKLLVEGDKAFEARDFEGAVTAYTAAAKAAPKDPAPIVGGVRARLSADGAPVDYNAAGQSGGAGNQALKTALVDLDKAIKLDPNYAPAHLEQGRALLVLGRAEDAKRSLEKALELDPNVAETHSALGVAHLALGNKEGAMRELGKAAAIEPGSAERQGNYGTALLMNGRVDEAVNTFERALKLAPNDPRLLTDLGTALLQSNQVDKAMIHLQKAVDLVPKKATYKNNLGYAKWVKGDNDGAIALFKEAVAIDDQLISAWVNLGNAHVRKKQLDEAAAAYAKAKAIDATDPRVVAALVDLDAAKRGDIPAGP